MRCRELHCTGWNFRTPEDGEDGEDLRAEVSVLREPVGRVADVVRLLDDLYDSVAGHGSSESGKWGRRRVRATDGELVGTEGYLCDGELELVCVPLLTTALALRPKAPRQRYIADSGSIATD
jgi:hypothetical protein